MAHFLYWRFFSKMFKKSAENTNETADSSLAHCHVRAETMTVDVHSFPDSRSAINRSSLNLHRVVCRWAGGRST